MHRLLLISLVALSLVACNKPGGSAQDKAASAAEGQAFLEKNAKAPGVTVTKSGLQYKVLKSGPEGGVHPKRSDEVKVHYEGRLLNGEIFDSSYENGAPISFVLSQVVPGWTEGLQLMKPGDVWELYLPPELGYGEQGKGPIPPNSALIFKVELLDVFPHPGP